MYAAAVAALRCPQGEPSLATDDRSLVCPAGHRFDLGRQGYVNLLMGPAPRGAETTAMVDARQAFQRAGHHEPLTAALRESVGRQVRSGDATDDDVAPVVVDLGAGTGHHLAAVLGALGERGAGIAVDVSKHAARRAARAHPRIGAVVADVWRDLPIRDAVADAVLVVFAPRNAGEIARIMRPDAALIVVTPAPSHLAPLDERLGLIGTEPAKLDHLDERLGELLRLRERRELTWKRELDRDDVAAVVASGPSAWHVDAEVVDRYLAGMSADVEVTFAVTISVYRRASVQ